MHTDSTSSYRTRSLLPRTKSLLTALSLALFLTMLSQQPASAGNTGAGLLQWSFSYLDTSVPVAIWFPTDEQTSQINAGPFTLQAAGNASPQSLQHPLVIISHGTGGSNIAHHPLAEALATHGYMVAALTHPGDNYQDRSLVADDRYFDERPRQFAALLQALVNDQTLGVLIDHERVGAIGHSAGGYTAAALIGATPDRQSLIEHCNRVDDDPSCNYRDPSIGVTSTTSTPFTLPAGTAGAEFRNLPPIKSVALLAPLGSVIDATSTINAEVAVITISAQFDHVLPHQYHRSRLQQVARHGTFREAEGAGHFSFIAPVEDPWKQQLGEVAQDPDGFDRDSFNKQLAQELTEWFNKSLPPLEQ